MSGNFLHCKRERQRIVYIYNITNLIYNLMYIIYVNNTLPLALAVHEISRHFWAVYAKSGDLCNVIDLVLNTWNLFCQVTSVCDGAFY